MEVRFLIKKIFFTLTNIQITFQIMTSEFISVTFAQLG